MKYTHQHKINNRKGYILATKEDMVVFKDEHEVMYLVPPNEVNKHWKEL